MNSCILLVDRALNGENYAILVNFKTMKELKLSQNNYVLVTGRDSKKIVCEIQKSDVKEDNALLNRVNRHNLGIYLKDAVTIQPCKDLAAGKEVTIGLVNCDDNKGLSKDIFKEVLHRYFTKSRRVLHEKNKFIVRGGMKALEFIVLSIIPKPYCFIDFNVTNIKFTNKTIRYQDNEKPLSQVSYDDIGGFNRLIQNIRSIVEPPLRFPSAFLELNVEVPKVIFYGPHGYGKALVAQAIANETGAKFVLINEKNTSGTLTERISKIKVMFRRACLFSPSVLCIDDIDLFLPQQCTTEENMKVANTLLQLLINLNGIDAVVILIGIASDLNNLHPMARDLFKNTNTVDKRFKFQIPDISGCMQILMIQTRNLNLVNDFSFTDLVNFTANLIPAKLASLCQRVAIKNKVLRDISTGNEESDDTYLLFQQCLTVKDFADCLKYKEFRQ